MIERHDSVSSSRVDSLEHRLTVALKDACRFLDAERTPLGHWTGELSTSALSTATAVSAISQVLQAHRQVPSLSESEVASLERIVHAGCAWLLEHQNADGGFGDTNKSHSNIATTFLVLAAWRLAGFSDAGQPSDVDSPVCAAQRYVDEQGSWDGLRRRYGKDKTFVVPILSNCALAGMVEWKRVPHLPFEAAWLPQKYYRLARMPVVSYAVPALVAIGQATFFHNTPFNPLVRCVRTAAKKPTLRVLDAMQPDSGGYLEATPLTSFVLMNLASIELANHPVAKRCLSFLVDSVLEDGSWPIDTNLATWVTSLGTLARSKAQKALALDEPRCSDAGVETTEAREEVLPVGGLDWLLSCQHLTRHPFTGADPGGWGWTDLSGAVPDSDDTPGAILALLSLGSLSTRPILNDRRLRATARGLNWLVRLQNRDGGMPTFCKGWGKLPFDRSGTDLTAHALRAMRAASGQLDSMRQLAEVPTDRQIQRFVERSFQFIAKRQLADGSWLPLWFGNQDREDEENPVYGTSKVLLAYASYGLSRSREAQRGIKYLKKCQNADGGWGGGPSVRYLTNSPQSSDLTSTIEETALAIEALCECGGQPATDASIMRGVEWLIDHSTPEVLANSQPIGFYFAKLWYHERLYPAIFSVAALASALSRLCAHDDA